MRMPNVMWFMGENRLEGIYDVCTIGHRLCGGEVADRSKRTMSTCHVYLDISSAVLSWDLYIITHCLTFYTHHMLEA